MLDHEAASLVELPRSWAERNKPAGSRICVDQPDDLVRERAAHATPLQLRRDAHPREHPERLVRLQTVELAAEARHLECAARGEAHPGTPTHQPDHEERLLSAAQRIAAGWHADPDPREPAVKACRVNLSLRHERADPAAEPRRDRSLDATGILPLEDVREQRLADEAACKERRAALDFVRSQPIDADVGFSRAVHRPNSPAPKPLRQACVPVRPAANLGDEDVTSALTRAPERASPVRPSRGLSRAAATEREALCQAAGCHS